MAALARDARPREGASMGRSRGVGFAGGSFSAVATVVRKKKPGPAKGSALAKEGAAKRVAKRRCEGTNVRGKPCGAVPFRPGSIVDGIEVSGRWCRIHAVENDELPSTSHIHSLRDEAWAAGAQKGRPKQTKPADMITAIVAADPLAFVEPHLRALGLQVIIGADGTVEEIRKTEKGGAKLYSTSDGHVYVSKTDDLEAQQRAAERLFDRGFGKPVQTNQLQGPDGGPVEIDVPTTADRVAEVAQVLRDLGLE